MEFLFQENSLSDKLSLIALPDKNGYRFIRIGNIIRCQSDNSYTEFTILDGASADPRYYKIVVSRGLEYYEKVLSKRNIFFRIHNRHLINIFHLKLYNKNNGGYIIMGDSPETMIPVARARREDFLDFLKVKGIME